MAEGRREPRAIRPISFGWGKRPRHPVRSRPKPTPRPNEHVRPRTHEELRTAFAHPPVARSPPTLQILCAQVPDGLFGTTAFFFLNEGVVPAAWSVGEPCSPATEGESESRRAGLSEGPAASGRRGSKSHGHRGQSPARGEPLPRARRLVVPADIVLHPPGLIPRALGLAPLYVENPLPPRKIN